MNSMRWLPMFCLNLSLSCQVLSAGFVKQAAITMHGFSAKAVVLNPWYLLSMLCLGIQSIVWPIVLRRYPLSYAYFYMSASYVAILLISAFVFYEPVTTGNLVGAALIMIGVNILVSGNRAGAPY